MATRSELTSMVQDPNKDNIRDLYTVIYYMDLLGGAFVNYVLAHTFNVGLDWGGRWTGLPLFCAAFMWLIVTAIVIFVRIKEEEKVQVSSVPEETPEPLRVNSENGVPPNSRS
jgi:hypothetical protein